MQQVNVAQRVQPRDDLEQHPLHQIIHIRLIADPSSDEGASWRTVPARAILPQ
jgi:hypothetical protein